MRARGAHTIYVQYTCFAWTGSSIALRLGAARTAACLCTALNAGTVIKHALYHASSPVRSGYAPDRVRQVYPRCGYTVSYAPTPLSRQCDSCSHVKFSPDIPMLIATLFSPIAASTASDCIHEFRRCRAYSYLLTPTRRPRNHRPPGSSWPSSCSAR